MRRTISVPLQDINITYEKLDTGKQILHTGKGPYHLSHDQRSRQEVWPEGSLAGWHHWYYASAIQHL